MSTLQTATPVLSKIRERGYWQVIIRPTTFNGHRIEDIHALFSIVEKNSVRFRGWDYPHIDIRERPRTGNDWIGQEYEWQHYLEVWRFYQSGQFFHTFGIAYDWRDQSTLWPAEQGWVPESVISVEDTLFHLTEIFEFASRLALSEAGAESMHVGVEIAHLRGRVLLFDPASHAMNFYKFKTEMSNYRISNEYAQAELIGRANELALESTMEFLKRFGYHPDRAALLEIQKSLPYVK